MSNKNKLALVPLSDNGIAIAPMDQESWQELGQDVADLKKANPRFMKQMNNRAKADQKQFNEQYRLEAVKRVNRIVKRVLMGEREYLRSKSAIDSEEFPQLLFDYYCKELEKRIKAIKG